MGEGRRDEEGGREGGREGRRRERTRGRRLELGSDLDLKDGEAIDPGDKLGEGGLSGTTHTNQQQMTLQTEKEEITYRRSPLGQSRSTTSVFAKTSECKGRTGEGRSLSPGSA